MLRVEFRLLSKTGVVPLRMVVTLMDGSRAVHVQETDSLDGLGALILQLLDVHSASARIG